MFEKLSMSCKSCRQDTLEVDKSKMRREVFAKLYPFLGCKWVADFRSTQKERKRSRSCHTNLKMVREVVHFPSMGPRSCPNRVENLDFPGPIVRIMDLDQYLEKMITITKLI